MGSLIFDFDRWAIGNLVIGEPYLDEDEKEFLGNQELGYVIRVSDGCIKSIFICLNAGYRNYKKFNGRFRKDKRDFDLSSSSKPEAIKKLFGEPDRQWNDGVEESMQFKKQGYQIEFVWRIRDFGLELNYTIAELD